MAISRFKNKTFLITALFFSFISAEVSNGLTCLPTYTSPRSFGLDIPIGNLNVCTVVTPVIGSPYKDCRAKRAGSFSLSFDNQVSEMINIYDELGATSNSDGRSKIAARYAEKSVSLILFMLRQSEGLIEEKICPSWSGKRKRNDPSVLVRASRGKKRDHTSMSLGLMRIKLGVENIMLLHSSLEKDFNGSRPGSSEGVIGLALTRFTGDYRNKPLISLKKTEGLYWIRQYYYIFSKFGELMHLLQSLDPSQKAIDFTNIDFYKTAAMQSHFPSLLKALELSRRDIEDHDQEVINPSERNRLLSGVNFSITDLERHK